MKELGMEGEENVIGSAVKKKGSTKTTKIVNIH